LGLECISEGVETAEQVELLTNNNCNLAQGFFFDRPLPIDEFEKRLSPDFVYKK
jgi:EAL domain-containing protein (putative c-di-GMP-specific phosphodiesterase class I)